MIRFLLAVSLLLIPALGQAQPLVSRGQITWGLAATFPPFEFVEDGKAVVTDALLSPTSTASTGMISIVVAHELGFAQRAADEITFIARRAPVGDFFSNAVPERVERFLNRMRT
jgi:hypothetical protein